jgi:hypothetical protein
MDADCVIVFHSESNSILKPRYRNWWYLFIGSLVNDYNKFQRFSFQYRNRTVDDHSNLDPLIKNYSCSN